MFENLISLFKRIGKKGQAEEKSKNTAKERLHLVLMQDRANVSADFLDMMRQEIVEVIKKYIDVDEKDIDVKLTNKTNDDGTMGAPALYANIPITGIKEQTKQQDIETETEETENTNPEISDESKKENTENERQEAENSNQEKEEEIVEKKEDVLNVSEKEISEEKEEVKEKSINNNAQKNNKNKRKKSNKK